MTVVLSPRTACRYLRNISDPRKQFHTNDGQVLKNLVDLTCYLKSCDGDAFKYHVSREHNHFSNWVSNVILDKDLASETSLVLERNPMRIMVSKRINLLVHYATRALGKREQAEMILEDVKLPGEYFMANNGRVLRNLWELKEFLETADENTISYHISPTRNDFYWWVSEILMDQELAENLLEASDSGLMAGYVANKISQLEAFRAHSSKDKITSYIDKIRETSL